MRRLLRCASLPTLHQRKEIDMTTISILPIEGNDIITGVDLATSGTPYFVGASTMHPRRHPSTCALRRT